MECVRAASYMMPLYVDDEEIKGFELHSFVSQRYPMLKIMPVVIESYKLCMNRQDIARKIHDFYGKLIDL